MKQEIRTDKFNTGHYAQPETSEKVDKFTNRSMMKKSGGIKDHLAMAIGGPPRLPRGNQIYRHTSSVKPRGAHYDPRGHFGSVARTGAGHGVYGYGGNVMSAIPGNAIGNPPNRRGGNAIGSPPNRMGQNAVGNPPHRKGPNAIGSAPNRVGENALASKFVPRGSWHGAGHRG